MVTGANGQLGKSLKHLSSAHSEFEFIFLSKEDLPIHHFEMARHYFKIHAPQYFINCAAYTAVDRAESERDLAFQVNGEAVGVLAAICKEHHTKFITISTDYVFDGNSTVPYKETDPVNPQNIYGASKHEGEKQAMKFDPTCIIIRSSWVYSEFGKNFVKTMLTLIRDKPDIKVVDDQVGSPTYSMDLAETIITIIASQIWKAGIYHYCNEGIINWYQFALAINKLTGSHCNISSIPTGEYPTLAKRPAFSSLDCNKIRETFNISLKGWQESLATCLKHIAEIKK